MSNHRHFFIEQTRDGKFVAKERDQDEPRDFFNTQEEALAYARRMNPADHPDVERVRNVEGGGRDQWRSAHR